MTTTQQHTTTYLYIYTYVERKLFQIKICNELNCIKQNKKNIHHTHKNTDTLIHILYLRIIKQSKCLK